MVKEVLDGVKGVRAIVTHHAFDTEKLNTKDADSLRKVLA